MTEIEFKVARGADWSAAEKIIEQVCAERGLSLTMKGSQAKYPGCIHWHYKNLPQSGTLELTLFAPERRIWAQVQDGRRAAWIERELPELRRAIEREINSSGRR